MKILVVDDDAVLRVMATDVLREARFDILEAATGQEAMSQLSSGERIDLVISDIVMPNMDGLELLEWIRSSPRLRGLPVIMCTGRADREVVTRAIELGVEDFIVKPFTSGPLLKRTRKALCRGKPVLAESNRVVYRLQITRKTYDAMLAALVRSLNQGLDELKQRSAGTDDSDRMNALIGAMKGGCDNLGAGRIGAVLGRLGDVLGSGSEVSPEDILGELEREVALLEWWLGEQG